MNDAHLPLRDIELIVITRVALGFGLGLLASSYLSETHRQWIGWSLVAIGGLSTIPLRSEVMQRRNPLRRSFDEPSLAALVHD